MRSCPYAELATVTNEALQNRGNYLHGRKESRVGYLEYCIVALYSQFLGIGRNGSIKALDRN
jgi:hypothetical protein